MNNFANVKTSQLTVMLDNEAFYLKRFPDLEKMINPNIHLKSPIRKNSIAFADGLLAASLPFDILWAILAFLPPAFLITLLLLVTTNVVSLGCAIIFSKISSKKVKKNNDQYESTIKSLYLREQILNELLTRQKMKLIELAKKLIERSDGKNYLSPLEHSEFNDDAWFKLAKDRARLCEIMNFNSGSKHIKPNPKIVLFDNINYVANVSSKNINTIKLIIKSLFSALYLFSALFASIFWCAIEVVTNLGFVGLGACMCGPVGVTIALSIALLVTIYAGYHYYKNNVETKLDQIEIKEKEQALLELQDEYQNNFNHLNFLNKLLDNLSLEEEKINLENCNNFAKLHSKESSGKINGNEMVEIADSQYGYYEFRPV